MSGYGGAPPSGWQDPYGGESQDRDPNNAYGPQDGWDPHGYGYGPPGVPHVSASNGSAMAALICNAVALSMCCNVFAIPGIVTAGIALGRIHTDPRSARNLTLWSWAIFAAAIVIVTTLIVILAIIDNAEPGYARPAESDPA